MHSSVPAGGEVRASDWIVAGSTRPEPHGSRCHGTGIGRVRRCHGAVDYPVYEHGDREVHFALGQGPWRRRHESRTLDLARDRRVGSTTMTVQVTPSTRGHDARRASLSHRLPVRLHRADHEPFSPRGDHRAERSSGSGLRPQRRRRAHMFGGIETAHRPTRPTPKGRRTWLELDEDGPQGSGSVSTTSSTAMAAGGGGRKVTAIPS